MMTLTQCLRRIGYTWIHTNLISCAARAVDGGLRDPGSCGDSFRCSNLRAVRGGATASATRFRVCKHAVANIEPVRCNDCFVMRSGLLWHVMFSVSAPRSTFALGRAKFFPRLIDHGASPSEAQQEEALKEAQELEEEARCQVWVHQIFQGLCE